MVLNAISTTAFVLLGKTYGGLMVDVRPTNAKLWARADPHRARAVGPRRDGGAQADREGRRARQGRAGHAPRRRPAPRAPASCWSSTRARCAPSSATVGRCSRRRRRERGRRERRRADDPLAPAARRCASAPRRLVIGLLSGTSADGTDAALCEIAGVGRDHPPRHARLRDHALPARRCASASSASRRPTPSELCDLDVLLGEAFADAALAVARRGRRRAWTRSTSSARTGRPRCTTRARPGAWARRCRSARPP